MNSNEIFRTFTGSFVVYAIVVSCSASSEKGRALETGGGAASNGDPTKAMEAGRMTGGSEAMGRGAGGAITSIVDAAIDRMTHPVPDARADPNQSGSRLRAKYLVGADGSKQFLSWHDSVRGEDCSFAVASDGTTRCMPNATYANYFADAKCSQPISSLPTGTCPGVAMPTYLAAPSACASAGPTLWTDVKPTTTSLYYGTPAACDVLGTGPKGYDFLIGTTKVDPTAFVAGTTQIE